MITTSRLRQHLGEAWGLDDALVEVHDGGMNSATWIVRQGDRRWVAKAVPVTARDQFVPGLAVAARVQEAGILAGAPVPTLDGRDVIEPDGYLLALLTWVEGVALTGRSRRDHELIGTTLSRVHRVLTGVSVAGAGRFHWVDPAADHLALRPWIRPAVVAAVARLEAVVPESLTWGLLHADPAPEAFRWDAACGTCGLIDWGAGLIGPLLYDLASAVMYVGGPDRATRLVEAYLRQGIVDPAEVERGLPSMLRFRWAVQADYFARRIVANDLTGIADPSGNERGLEHARVWLDGLQP